MERINFENNFEKKEKGENVAWTIVFLRHADKDGWGGDISRTGFEKAGKFGKGLSIPEGQKELKIFISQHCRTEETALAIGDESGISYEIVDEERLGVLSKKVENYNDESGYIFSNSFIKEIKDFIVNEGISGGDKEDRVVQYVVNAGKPDDKTLSSKEIGRRIESLVEELIESSKNAMSNSQEKILAVSHSGILEHFLVHLLMRINPDKYNNVNDVIEKIGGGVGFLENFQIDVFRKNNDAVNIRLRFRDEQYDITREDLEKAFK